MYSLSFSGGLQLLRLGNIRSYEKLETQKTVQKLPSSRERRVPKPKYFNLDKKKLDSA